MRKFLTILAAGLLLLASFTSCSKLNKDTNFTVGYSYGLHFADKTVENEVEEYIKNTFLTTAMQPTYYGKIHDAATQAAEFFKGVVANPEITEYFDSKIQDENDYVVIECYIRSEYGDCWIGTRTWKWSGPQPNS